MKRVAIPINARAWELLNLACRIEERSYSYIFNEAIDQYLKTAPLREETTPSPQVVGAANLAGFMSIQIGRKLAKNLIRTAAHRGLTPQQLAYKAFEWYMSKEGFSFLEEWGDSIPPELREEFLNTGLYHGFDIRTSLPVDESNRPNIALDAIMDTLDKPPDDEDPAA